MVLTKEEWDKYRSEEYALEREKGERQWHETYDDIIEQALCSFNNILSGNVCDIEKSFEEIINFPNYVEVFGSVEKMMYIYIIYHIWKQELQQGASNILDVANDYDELLSVFQTVKYLLWRIEFCKEPDAIVQFLEYVIDFQISEVAIQNLLLLYVVDKKYICEKLAEAFLIVGKKNVALKVMEVAYMGDDE